MCCQDLIPQLCQGFAERGQGDAYLLYPAVQADMCSEPDFLSLRPGRFAHCYTERLPQVTSTACLANAARCRLQPDVTHHLVPLQTAHLSTAMEMSAGLATPRFTLALGTAMMAGWLSKPYVSATLSAMSRRLRRSGPPVPATVQLCKAMGSGVE
jgi:hypothetical protein